MRNMNGSFRPLNPQQERTEGSEMIWNTSENFVADFFVGHT